MMLSIKSLPAIEGIPDPVMRQSVRDSLAQVLANHPGEYSPDAHGWFLIVENATDLDDGSVLPAGVTVREVLLTQRFEWLGQTETFAIAVLVLDDSEAVEIYVPTALMDESLLAVVGAYGEPVQVSAPPPLPGGAV